jgi:hypothetical protein
MRKSKTLNSCAISQINKYGVRPLCNQVKSERLDPSCRHLVMQVGLLNKARFFPRIIEVHC